VILVNRGEMLGYVLRRCLKQFRNVTLGEPDRLIRQTDVDPGPAVLCLVEKELAGIVWSRSREVPGHDEGAEGIPQRVDFWKTDYW